LGHPPPLEGRREGRREEARWKLVIQRPVGAEQAAAAASLTNTQLAHKAAAGVHAGIIAEERVACARPGIAGGRSYSVSHSKASAWLPVLDLLYGYFGIDDTDDPPRRREKVRATLAALDPTLRDTLPHLFA
jgi:hypothetical protein